MRWRRMPRFASELKLLIACFARRRVAAGLRFVRAVSTSRKAWAIFAFIACADFAPPRAFDDWACSIVDIVRSRQATTSKLAWGSSRQDGGGTVVGVVSGAVVAVGVVEVVLALVDGPCGTVVVTAVLVGEAEVVVVRDVEEVLEDEVDVVVVEEGPQVSSQHGRLALSTRSGPGLIVANGPIVG